MSDTSSSLSQLASFVGQSALIGPDPVDRARALDAIAGNLALRPRRSVGDLLGAVLALSARTRRMVMPEVTIEMDVFSPDGSRAVQIALPHRG
jgi:hypothetical protein